MRLIDADVIDWEKIENLAQTIKLFKVKAILYCTFLLFNGIM